MLCGNKTDSCPNCHQFIRRAIFAYHYENNCANLEEEKTTNQQSISSSNHRFSSKIINDQENNPPDNSFNRPSSATKPKSGNFSLIHFRLDVNYLFSNEIM